MEHWHEPGSNTDIDFGVALEEMYHVRSIVEMISQQKNNWVMCFKSLSSKSASFFKAKVKASKMGGFSVFFCFL